MSDRAEQIFERARAFIAHLGPDDDHAFLLERALEGSPGTRFVLTRVVDLVCLVHGAIAGEGAPCDGLATAILFEEAGVQLLDDLQDDELAPAFASLPAGDIALIVSGLISVLPQLLLASLDAAPGLRVELLRRMAHGLLRVSRGQQRDLRAEKLGVPRSAELEAVAGVKAGERIATHVSLAAIHAGAGPDLVERYARFGHALGTATNLHSGCLDVALRRARSPAALVWTLPVALHLERSKVDEAAFLAQSGGSAEDPWAGGELARKVSESGALRAALLVSEVHRQRAVRLLAEARPLEPAGAGLRRMLDPMVIQEIPSS